MRYNIHNTVLFVVLCAGIGIRAIVSLSSYSGASTPPLFGDYEAQRHWQEITFNLPAREWYLTTKDNDLLYWGLDYPPLTAYHSFILGIIADRLNSSYVNLFSSRGFESVDHKSFMRITVLVADLFVYLPAIALVMFSLKSVTSTCVLPSVMILVFYPCQILIDNGHFQYNNISLGLFLISVASLLRNRNNWASLAFSLALNYKQMELYHALPICVYLIKSSFFTKSFLKTLFKIIEIGVITITTFIILWTPWISSVKALLSTVFRLFPLNRGVFEDKIANVWCTLNAFYKLKENLKNYQMAFVCAVATLTAIAPSNIHLFFDCKKKNFLCTLVNTSLSFFLLSFQVHEKSILLAAIPSCFIFDMMPFSVLCFLKMSTFSIVPLLIRDNLLNIYFGIFVSYSILFKYLIQLVYSKNNKTQVKLSFLMNLLDIMILATSLATSMLPSPKRYPFLWPFFISFICFISFILFFFESYLLQIKIF